MVVLGAGTGLGVACLVPRSDQAVVVQSEGGTRNPGGIVRPGGSDYPAAPQPLWTRIGRACAFWTRPGKYLSGDRRIRQSCNAAARRDTNNEQRTAW
jgi:Glucokinase